MSPFSRMITVTIMNLSPAVTFVLVCSKLSASHLTAALKSVAPPFVTTNSASHLTFTALKPVPSPFVTTK